MSEQSRATTYVAITIAVLIGALMAMAGSDGGKQFHGLPIFALCGAIAFAINWLAFIPAALYKTEHFYDLVGGITYVTTMAVAVLLSTDLDLRATLAAAMVMFWAIRLASFLFLRIRKSGSDSRFNEIKQRPARFLMAWTLQGLWVLITAAAALAIVTSSKSVPLEVTGIAGIVIWSIGMLIEVIADRQKSAFKADDANQGKFINVGLWAWSRHPNYFGEIVLWTGMAVVALPVLQGWQWATLLSPVFVAILLTRISGIPMLEAKADKRWGGQSDYEDYKRRTPRLIPIPPALQSR